MTINGLTWTLKNTSTGKISGSGWSIEPGLSYPPSPNPGNIVVTVLDPTMIKAINSGLLTATPSTPSLTTSVGTASATGTIADVSGSYSQLLVNNNFATIANTINALFSTIEELQFLVLSNRYKLNQ